LKFKKSINLTHLWENTMQKIFRVKSNGKISGFVSFGGNSRDRRTAARKLQTLYRELKDFGSTVTVQRVRGATSTVPVKHYVGGWDE
jgi:hypothetical protein